MNRHPAGSWYGKLDVLLFMKSAVFIFHFYSWALDLTVNAFKTDSALLGSWIKAMVLIMTLLASDHSSVLLVFLPSRDFRVLCHCTIQFAEITFQSPLCAHDISPACNNGWNSTECVAVPTSTWIWSSDLNQVTLHLNAVIPWIVVTFFCIWTDFCVCARSVVCFPCVLFASHIWLHLTPGEFSLLG